MGVVWKAVDPNLDREVAIKLLPDSMNTAADRLVRFEREAKLLASISHPNIAVVHGLHEVDQTRFLAMELVPGEDLEHRLRRGRLSLEDLLKIAIPIADALEAAHEQGVVHRDLKPANVIVTPEGSVKVLDFGLAKSLDAAPAEMDFSSPTLTSAGTMAGVILGTAGYMAPEQAKGHLVDRRADIWAFGVLLYEMLTGSRVYDEPTVSEALAAVLLKEPEWERLPAETPVSLERLVRRCLTKDPRARLRDMGEARITLERLARGDDESDLAMPAGDSRAGRWTPRALALGIILGCGLGFGLGFGLMRLLSPSSPGNLERDALALSINAPEGVREAISPVVAPDGKSVVYRGIGEGNVHLYRRDLVSGTTERIPGTQGANNPFFSPDGRWLGFFGGGGLKKVATIGGDPLNILDGVRSGSPGAVWLEDGSILYSDWLTGFFRVSADGGEPETLTTPNAEAGEIAHWWPQRLPGGRHVLFTIWPTGAGINDAFVAVLDLNDNTWSTLFSGARAEFAAPDRLLFYRAGNYLETRIDPSTLELRGEPTPVSYPIQKQYPHGSSRQTFALGPDGMLVYVAGESLFPLRSLVWFDRDGKKTRATAEDRATLEMSLSPDGRRVVTSEFIAGRFALFLNDLVRGTREQLVLEGSAFRPRWIPGGDRFSYGVLRRGNFDAYTARPDGSDEQVLLRGDQDEEVEGWFSDGKRFLANLSGHGSTTLEEIHRETGPIQTMETGGYNGGRLDISRDDEWFTFSIGVSGRSEVYVQRASPSGPRVRVSSQGGSEPRFSAVKNEIFFFRGNEVVVADYSTNGDQFVVGAEQVLFEAEDIRGDHGESWAIGPEGQRILMLQPGASGNSRPELRVVYGW